MDFGLSEDQVLLETTVRALLAEQVPIERVRVLREADCPNDHGLWKAFAELGLSGILVPESEGGSGLQMLDALLVSQALGHAATPSPFLSTAVMATMVLREIPHPKSTEWLQQIAAGEILFGVAMTELFSVREGAGVRLEEGRLHGKSMMALDACGADFLLVALGEDRVAVVDRRGQGVRTNRLLLTDATRCTAEVLFDGATPEIVFENASQALSRALEAGRIALAGDQFGACESMIARAVAYAKQRKQFDRLIGSFQAVKHMCAEMIAELEPTRSLLWYAAHAFDTLPAESPLMALHALAHVSEIGRDIASVSTQVHGGIGWTDEENLHFWFKRIGSGRHLLGGPEVLRARAASLQGLDGIASTG